MQAGEREFRYRFWIFFAIFWAAFLCYAIDHRNAGEALLRLTVPGFDADPVRGRRLVQLLFGAGAAIAFAGALLRSWATAYLRSAVVHDGAVHTEGLVADGPYRFVRNPLYLGTQLLMFGVALVASRLGAIVLLVAGSVFHLRLIAREEAALLAAQGEPFRAYCARVPRFVPSLTPRVPPAGGAPRWGEGLLAEAFMWLMGIAMLAFAITLDGRSLLITSVAGVALYWIVTSALKRRSGPGTQR
jgi:hypothetical protein